MNRCYILTVKNVTSKVPRSQFNHQEIEELANRILAADGLLAPLILRQIDMDTLEVIAGHKAYYAAVRAREINPRAAEMVNGFVVPDEQAEAAVAQLQALYPDSAQTLLPAAAGTEDRLSNLENYLGRVLDEMRKDSRDMRKDINTLVQTITGLAEKLDKLTLASPKPAGKRKNLPPDLLLYDQDPELLKVANTSEDLEARFNQAEIKGQTAWKIVNFIKEARQVTPFTSLTDIYNRVKDLGPARIPKFVEALRLDPENLPF